MKYSVVVLLFLVASAEPKCDVEPFITVNYGGRLGNCIWEFMSMYAVAKELPTPRKPHSQRLLTQKLQTIFENVNLPLMETLPGECWDNFDLILGNIALKDLFPMKGIEEKLANRTDNLVLPQCIVLLEPVLKHMDHIKRAFPYRRELVEKVYNTLSVIGEKFIKKTGIINFTFVGVHIRRTDFIEFLPTQNQTSVDEWYYKFGMDYFKNRTDLGRPIFVIATDDPAWAAKHYKGDNVYISSGDIGSPQADLVLLSMCNHSIIDYGTFGLWGAVYAGGETVAVYQRGTQVHIVTRDKWHFVNTKTRQFV